jgi:hypothetical protein
MLLESDHIFVQPLAMRRTVGALGPVSAQAFVLAAQGQGPPLQGLVLGKKRRLF